MAPKRKATTAAVLEDTPAASAAVPAAKVKKAKVTQTASAAIKKHFHIEHCKS